MKIRTLGNFFSALAWASADNSKWKHNLRCGVLHEIHTSAAVAVNKPALEAAKADARSAAIASRYPRTTSAVLAAGPLFIIIAGYSV